MARPTLPTRCVDASVTSVGYSMPLLGLEASKEAIDDLFDKFDPERLEPSSYGHGGVLSTLPHMAGSTPTVRARSSTRSSNASSQNGPPPSSAQLPVPSAPLAQPCAHPPAHTLSRAHRLATLTSNDPNYLRFVRDEGPSSKLLGSQSSDPDYLRRASRTSGRGDSPGGSKKGGRGERPAPAPRTRRPASTARPGRHAPQPTHPARCAPLPSLGCSCGLAAARPVRVIVGRAVRRRRGIAHLASLVTGAGRASSEEKKRVSISSSVIDTSSRDSGRSSPSVSIVSPNSAAAAARAFADEVARQEEAGGGPSRPPPDPSVSTWGVAGEDF